MANTKISALPAGDPAQNTDAFPIARSGSNFKVTTAGILKSVDVAYSAGVENNTDNAGQSAETTLSAEGNDYTSEVDISVDEAGGSGTVAAQAASGNAGNAVFSANATGSTYTTTVRAAADDSATSASVVITALNGVSEIDINAGSGDVNIQAADGVGTSTISVEADGSNHQIILTTNDGATASTLRVAAAYTQIDAVTLTPTLFASLPTVGEGSIACIHDSTTNTWGAAISGSGSFKVIGSFVNGSWTVMGK